MSAPTDMPCIFNCQMGRGRTTTGMILGALVKIWLMKKCDIYIKKYETVQTSSLLNGYYQCVNRLLRVLENGLKAKMLLDLLINNCSAMQNLRETIADYTVYIFFYYFLFFRDNHWILTLLIRRERRVVQQPMDS